MEKVKRLTGRTMVGGGYSTSTATLKLKKLQNSITKAITETVATAIEETMSGESSNTATNSTNAVK